MLYFLVRHLLREGSISSMELQVVGELSSRTERAKLKSPRNVFYKLFVVIQRLHSALYCSVKG